MELNILVEGMGHINFGQGINSDKKGTYIFIYLSLFI
jgi:hypothetical protein